MTYNEMKEIYNGKPILFRCGDYYECVGEDAQTVADACGIIANKKDGELQCGFPHHCLDEYLPKLHREGVEVYIVDETPEPQDQRGTSVVRVSEHHL